MLPAKSVVTTSMRTELVNTVSGVYDVIVSVVERRAIDVYVHVLYSCTYGGIERKGTS